MTLVISNCSKRKRLAPDEALRAATLAEGAAEQVADAWCERLTDADSAIAPKNLYGGRGFTEAVRAATAADAKLCVVSAGLGLVQADALVPSYSLTTAARDPDNILLKTRGSAAEWWAVLKARSPYTTEAHGEEEGLILAALSSGYLTLVASEWAQWPAERLSRLRLFTKEAASDLPQSLRDAWMPYDDRLDAIGDGHAGTQSDFAQRALRHFATTIGDQGTLEAHRAAVLASLSGLKARQIPTRTRFSDSEIQTLIRTEWEAVGGRSVAMLRRLRDDLGVACEQSRFKGLFRAVAAEKQKGTLL